MYILSTSTIESRFNTLKGKTKYNEKRMEVPKIFNVLHNFLYAHFLSLCLVGSFGVLCLPCPNFIYLSLTLNGFVDFNVDNHLAQLLLTSIVTITYAFQFYLDDLQFVDAFFWIFII
jgi:hypothetical protein